VASRARKEWRVRVGLPPEPPRDHGGVKCRICVNECTIGNGRLGFCGVWTSRGGFLVPAAGRGKLNMYSYLDPLPTNCVAAPVCPAATARGYPVYTRTRGPEIGCYNLAVFMAGCSLDCYFCQNIDHKYMVSPGKRVLRGEVASVESLLERTLSEDSVTCVCFFGGDPTPHAPMLLGYSLKLLMAARSRGSIKRVCWETNGLLSPNLMRVAGRVSLESGGIVKIDWKAWTPSVYQALTGVDGEKAIDRIKENVKLLAKMARERDEPPLLVVSVLLVPGYVGSREVEGIARFLSSFEANIPMVLLAFYPQHLMWDLPTTSYDHMMRARRAAEESGIREVYIGNPWLLKRGYLAEEFES